MATFNGYLLKRFVSSGDELVADEAFPMEYIDASSWKSTPNSREEIKAYRDENTRDLTRVTAAGHKTAISFDTRTNLHLADKEAIQKWFTDAETNSEERKIYLQYWNDESNTYETNYFYRGDIEFTIIRTTDSDIIYDKVTIQLVEY